MTRKYTAEIWISKLSEATDNELDDDVLESISEDLAKYADNDLKITERDMYRVLSDYGYSSSETVAETSKGSSSNTLPTLSLASDELSSNTSALPDLYDLSSNLDFASVYETQTSLASSVDILSDIAETDKVGELYDSIEERTNTELDPAVSAKLESAAQAASVKIGSVLGTGLSKSLASIAAGVNPALGLAVVQASSKLGARLMEAATDEDVSFDWGGFLTDAALSTIGTLAFGPVGLALPTVVDLVDTSWRKLSSMLTGLDLENTEGLTELSYSDLAFSSESYDALGEALDSIDFGTDLSLDSYDFDLDLDGGSSDDSGFADDAGIGGGDLGYGGGYSE